ncbi:UNVERIFIED_CONTAM: hypothetical protein HDU68_004064 [Siphonaria sp. JEL0065]|nr:hypothetical protein HDU68_004064 [Siphonaria sp. JEL0065]
MDSEIAAASLAAIAVSFLIYRLLLAPVSFTAANIPHLRGKTAIITGANSGLGFASAKAMAARGCRIIMACRSQEKASKAIAEIKQQVPDADLVFMKLDLSDWDSVKAFAEEFVALKLPIHILMNNAGIMALPRFSLSKHAIELQMAGNHLGHFYMTLLLLPVLEKTARECAKKGESIRIVNLSSIGHWITYWRGIDFEHLNDPSFYQPWLAYGQSKLANLLFSSQLQKRLDKAWGLENVYVNSVHPGGVCTNLGVESAYVGFLWGNPIMKLVVPSSDQGALTQLYCATSEEVVVKELKGRYLVPTASLATPSFHGQNEKLEEQLWDWSVRVLEERGFAVPAI